MARRKVLVNGREFEITDDGNGAVPARVLHEVAGIDQNSRQLVHQRRSGENIIVSPDSEVLVQPNDYFIDMPKATRGR